MPITSPAQLEKAINWEFAGKVGSLDTRFGTLAGRFYRQVHQGGHSLPNVWPPREIPKEQYEEALARSKR